jgi:hypothetical protein
MKIQLKPRSQITLGAAHPWYTPVQVEDMFITGNSWDLGYQLLIAQVLT